jgi:DnaK suppressor protein
MSAASETPQRDDLQEILEQQRRELMAGLQRRMRRLREAGSEPATIRDDEDGDPLALDARLVEIAAATIRRIDAAIERLRGGFYGRCRRCGRSIADSRLRAMPFAVYCHNCESVREDERPAGRTPLRARLWAPSSETADRSSFGQP